MIAIRNIKHVGRNNGFAQTWAIVHSMQHPSSWITQVQALSPSQDLLRKYLYLKNNKLWDKNAFHTIYVPQFLHEMHSPDAVAALNQAFSLSRTGRDLAIVCFCPDEAYCHRSIIAGLLQGIGADVRTETGADYSDYYRLWKEYD